MSKNYHWITTFLIFLELTARPECLGNNPWRHLAHRGVFFLRPFPEEAAPLPQPPINLFRPIRDRRPDETQRDTVPWRPTIRDSKRPEETQRNTVPRRPTVRVTRRPVFDETQRDPVPWTPTIRDSRRLSPKRPFAGRAISVAAASPSVVTAQPQQTFDIQLKKSIRVSNDELNRSFARANDKQTTAPSEVDVTEFDDRWQPKPRPSRKPPIPFTRFGGEKMGPKKIDLLPRPNVMKPSSSYMSRPTANYVRPHVTHSNGEMDSGVRSSENGSKSNGGENNTDQNNVDRPLANVSSNNHRQGLPNADQSSPVLSDTQKGSAAPVMKLVEVVTGPADKNSVFFVQNTNIESKYNDSKDKTANLIVLDPKNLNSLQNGETKPSLTTGRRIPSNPQTELNGIPNAIIPQANDTNQNLPNVATRDSNSPVDKVTAFVNPLYPNPPLHGSGVSGPQGYSNEPIYFPQNFPHFPRPSVGKNNVSSSLGSDNNAELEKLVEYGPKTMLEKKSNQDFGNYQDGDGSKKPNQVYHQDGQKPNQDLGKHQLGGMSQTPNQDFMYHQGGQKPNQDLGKQQLGGMGQTPNQDFMYHQGGQKPNQDFKEPNRNLQLAGVSKNPNQDLGKHQLGGMSQTPHQDFKKPNFENHQRGGSQKPNQTFGYYQEDGKGKKQFNQDFKKPNQDFGIHHQHSPKSPAGDFHSLVQRVNTPPSLITSDPDLLRNHKNRSNTYVLQRPPLEHPHRPQRRPNIRLSTGMLAGILIAALIFLGFLTGTTVYTVHQCRYRPKKERQKKKRSAPYAPEYVDETFAGNTYIHNNIFLPNPHNLEDRLSPTEELDTSFSVDSEETAQVTDHRPSTSGHVRGEFD